MLHLEAPAGRFRFLEQGAEFALRTGDRVLEARAVLYRSVTARFAGDIDDAVGWAERAELVSRQAGLDEYVAAVHAQRGWAALRRGEPVRARQELEAALEGWSRLLYLFPPRFLGQLPLMALAVQEERFADAAAIAAAMLPPPLAQLREPVWSALHDAADGVDPERLRRAVALAQQAGYL
ncbi:MAG TPA: hypothetical protein VK939_03650 [Longimicrobiales bacterium]|nr:hypothetical protein [Longimicrobiales bacterium]